MFTRSALIALAFLSAGAQAAVAQTLERPAVTHQKVKKADIDYAKARPFVLPGNDAAPTEQADLILQGAQPTEGPSGFEPGGKGSGDKQPIKLPKSKWVSDDVSSQAFGTSNHPFTTATQSDASLDPYRRAGKLFFSDNGGSFICSASMIKPGIAVTAAHCVSEFGKKRFYTGFKYVPAYRDGDAPFGEWAAQDVFIMTTYYTGKDKCAVKGVVCENDVALLVLTPQGTSFAGNRTGWFGYAWGGYSYTKNKQVLITQLGYPGALNNGQIMMRTDSQGAVDKKQSGNTIIGSLQTGGSSGGPWLANFGFAPSLSDGVKAGKDANRLVVVGATSWGYTNQAVKEQGASPFTSDNIKVLIEDACKAYPGNC